MCTTYQEPDSHLPHCFRPYLLIINNISRNNLNILLLKFKYIDKWFARYALLPHVSAAHRSLLFLKQLTMKFRHNSLSRMLLFRVAQSEMSVYSWRFTDIFYLIVWLFILLARFVPISLSPSEVFPRPLSLPVRSFVVDTGLSRGLQSQTAFLCVQCVGFVLDLLDQ